MMSSYQIYGLHLITNIALPGLSPISPQPSDLPTVEIFLGDLPDWLPRNPQNSVSASDWYRCQAQSVADGAEAVSPLQVWQIDENRYFYCRYEDGTIFIVSRLGTQIWATWPDDLTLEDTATYLLGPILGFALRLRGTVCLHASAIDIDDRVVVLVGDAGAGKSTTSAAFAQQGYPILSDDVVPLVDRGDTFLVLPAYPRIRLWDDAVQALYGAADALPRLVPTHPTWDKRYLDLNQTGYKFQSEPLPLAAIYYLTDRSNEPSSPHIEPMATPEQLITLVTNTYTNYLLDKQLRAQEFELLSRLIQYIPVRQITPHQNIDRLPELISTILHDFRSTIASK